MLRKLNADHILGVTLGDIVGTKIFHIRLACDGISSALGNQAAHDISHQLKHRDWHKDAKCVWDGVQLILEARNDFDKDGRALVDEFSDLISATVSSGFD